MPPCKPRSEAVVDCMASFVFCGLLSILYLDETILYAVLMILQLLEMDETNSLNPKYASIGSCLFVNLEDPVVLAQEGIIGDAINMCGRR